jgi:hypothetical protein
MEQQSQSRRRFPRVPSENVVLFQKLETGSEEELAKTRVVGLGGCMFVSETPVNRGALIELLISVSGRVVKTEGRVVWSEEKGPREFHVGVEFVKLSPSDRHTLSKLFQEAKSG